MASKYDKQIKQATTATKPVVDKSYSAGAYAKQNATVASTAQNQIKNATTRAESAYKMATANNERRSSEVESNNNTLTGQIGNSMRKRNFSLTNRNIASAASARNAATNAAALASANQNAKATRNAAISQAQTSALKQQATLQASNTQKDIDRSTQKAVTKAQQKFQSSEAKKNRQLKNAISKKQKAYDKTQRELSSYSKTLEARYTSIKAIDKAIKKMKASNDKQKSEKLAYLRALRVKLADAKAAGGSGGGRGGRGGRGYGRRGYGYGSGSDVGNEKIKNDSSGKSKGGSDDVNLSTAYALAINSLGGKQKGIAKPSNGTRVVGLGLTPKATSAKKSDQAKAKAIKNSIKYTKGKTSTLRASAKKRK